MQRGLYVDIYNKVDFVTVEWEPVGYTDRREHRVDYAVEAEA